MLELWNNGQKIDNVSIVPVLHHSSIPIPQSLWSDPAIVLSYESRPGGMHSKDGRYVASKLRIAYHITAILAVHPAAGLVAKYNRWIRP